MSEKEKSAGKLLEEQLTFSFPHIGKEAPKQVDESAAFCEGYKAFLNEGKTERECVEAAVNRLEAAGYHAIDFTKQYQPGDKVYFINRKKAIIMTTFGEKPVKEGVRINGAHIDSPRLDLKPNPVYEKTEYRFTDIRPGVGACASIIAQYFFENEIPMDQRIATALTFGIRMDTQKLSRGVCKMDMEMIWRMFDLCDQDMIYLLENSTLYFEDLMAYSKAISSIEVFENISFADTGRDCPEALIASVSDFMLALVEVSFSVVYSRKKEGIKISVRSERPTLDAGKIISKALKGIGSGGGHATMAGGFVPFDGNDREEDLMIQNIRERFIDVISRTKRKSLR